MERIAPDKAKRIQRRNWIIVIGVASVLLIGGIVHWVRFVEPRNEHRRYYERLNRAVDLIESKPPADLTPEEWGFLILWTRNAVGNCCAVIEYLHKPPRFHQFVEEVEHRARGEVSIETIDWFWDELETFSRYGEWYAERFRPTTWERL